LQPLFKRSVTFETCDDADMAEKAAVWGGLFEFGDMAWLPQQRKVIYRNDSRVDVKSPGDGLNNYLGFRPNPSAALATARIAEVLLEKEGADVARCEAAQGPAALFEKEAYGFTNDGVVFTRYPVVGFQHRIQASGTCIDGPEDLLATSCVWDQRVGGLFIYSTAFSVAVSKAPAFIREMQLLRDLNPSAFCDLDAKMGILLRYIKASSACLGKPEDTIDFDVTYYRSRTEGVPRPHSDVLDELEQMALRKYGALPHWGKNRNFAFDGVIARYPKAEQFLEVKRRYDHDGIFSNEWSDQVLGIDGSRPIIVEDGCAIEGLCICSKDSHCAPKKGYFCRPGKVYKEARVCSYEPATFWTSGVP
jgi:FAD-dependent oxidoreductase